MTTTASQRKRSPNASRTLLFTSVSHAKYLGLTPDSPFGSATAPGPAVWWIRRLCKCAANHETLQGGLVASVLNRLSLRSSNWLSGPRTFCSCSCFRPRFMRPAWTWRGIPSPRGSLSGYMVYYGPALGSPLANPVQGADTKVDVGNNTTYTVPNLAQGRPIVSQSRHTTPGAPKAAFPMK